MLSRRLKADCVQMQKRPTWPPGAIFSRFSLSTLIRVIPTHRQTPDLNAIGVNSNRHEKWWLYVLTSISPMPATQQVIQRRVFYMQDIEASLKNSMWNFKLFMKIVKSVHQRWFRVFFISINNTDQWNHHLDCILCALNVFYCVRVCV